MMLLTLFQAADDGIFRLINRTLENPVFDRLMPILSDKWVAFALAAGLLALVSVRGDRRAWLLVGVAAITSVALSDATGNLIKHLADRTRPCHVLPEVHLLAGCTRSFSLPSNHATNLFALAAVVWRTCTVALDPGRSGDRRRLLEGLPRSPLSFGRPGRSSLGGQRGVGRDSGRAVHLWPGLLRRRDAEHGIGPESA